MLSRTLLVAELRGVHEAHFLHVIALGSGHHLGGHLVARTPVGPQVNLRLRLLVTLGTEEALQLRNTADHRSVPDDRAIEVDIDLDDLRTHVRGRIVGLRHVEFRRVRHHRNRHDQHDDEHQHHVDERSRIDLHHRVALATTTHTHCHEKLPRKLQRVTRMLPLSGSVMKPTLTMPPRCRLKMTRPTPSQRASRSPRIWNSGCGTLRASATMRWKNTCLSSMRPAFQKILPSLSTEMVMFSGFVCVGMFTAFGITTFAIFWITGTVI